MLPISLGETSFRYGPVEIPYGNVVSAGVGVRRRRRTGDHRVLLMSYLLPGEAKNRLINFGLEPGPRGEQFAAAFRAHVANRWLGEALYADMRKQLGFPTTAVRGVVWAIVGVTVISVVAWAATMRQPDPAPRRPDTSTRAPAR